MIRRKCHNFFSFPSRLNNNSGIILIIVLWALVILTVLTTSLGRSTHIELALIKHRLGKMQSYHAAVAGVNYAKALIRQDSQNDGSKDTDILFFCAAPSGTEKTLQDFFQDVSVGPNTFRLEYLQPVRDVGAVSSVIVGETHQKNVTVETGAETDISREIHFVTYWGLSDEERKINLNALNTNSVKVFQELIELFGFGEEEAQTAAYSTVDWIDANDVISEETHGAENEFYEGLADAYKTKNLPFDSVEELKLVRGVTDEIYEAVRPFVTVFPKTGGQMKINFDTASEHVLTALARAHSGAATNTEVSDADSLVQKMVEYRRGDDLEEMTEDDRPIEFNEITLNAKERALFLVINSQYRTKTSNLLLARVVGVDQLRGVETTIEAVISRDDLKILSWRLF